jgi:hypothetical protein
MASAFARFIYISREVVNLVGIIGNIISFLVFCRPVFKKNSIRVYACALAIFDCFTLNQLYVDFGLIFFDYYPPDHSDITCKIYYYISTAFSCIPPWILVVFSIDKILSMKKSPKFKLFKKRFFQLTLIAVFAIVNILIFSEILVLLVRTPEIDDISSNLTLLCDSTVMPYANIVGAMYLLLGGIVPFVIMLGTSISIARLLSHSRQKSIGDRKIALARRRKSRDFKFAVTSLTFNFLFIALKLPLVLYYVISSFNIDTPSVYFYISTLLFFINSSISFLVHFVSNSIFRKQFYLLIKCRSSLSVDQSTVISVRPLQPTVK